MRAPCAVHRERLEQREQRVGARDVRGQHFECDGIDGAGLAAEDVDHALKLDLGGIRKHR